MSAAKKTSKENYSGIKPQKGWTRRNLTMLQKHVVPGIFKKRKGATKQVTNGQAHPGAVHITWLGHAGFFIEIGNRSLIIDPNFAKWHGIIKRLREPGLHLHELPEVDAVLVSHAHHDHLHKKSLKVIQSRNGIIVPLGSASLVKKLDFSTVQEMKTWETLEIAGMEIIHTPAHHWGARFIHDTHRDYGGYIVNYDGRSIFHCGDSAYFDGFKEIGKRYNIDIALIPIGAYDAPSGRNVHMNPEEALQAFLELGAQYFIPMHYGTFALGNEPLHEPVERLLAEAARLGISDRILVPEEGDCVIF